MTPGFRPAAPRRRHERLHAIKRKAASLCIELGDAEPLSVRRAYDFLWDVVGSSTCFPGIVSCSRVGADTYRFRYRETSLAGLSMAVRYTARYRRLEHGKSGATRISVRQALAPDTPVPRLLQPLVRSFVESGARHVLERYLEHVKHALEESP